MDHKPVGNKGSEKVGVGSECVHAVMRGVCKECKEVPGSWTVGQGTAI